MKLPGAVATDLESLVVEPEDQLRAQVYQLLASFLREPPSAELLRNCQNLRGDDTDLGRAINTLAKLSAATTEDEATKEYNDLFIGVGRGELVPYGSYYLTGFLNEKPLAKLRNDMTRLGIARSENTSDPEDHIAALCEIMAGLIEGAFAKPASLNEQKTFFDKHVSSWAPHFFEDLEAAKKSRLYVAVGAIGIAFMHIEGAAFRMGMA